MQTKSAKRRRKISLPGGQSVDQRPTGKDRRHTNQPEDARLTVTTARIRRSGVTDPKEAQQPICGTDMGLCIRYLTTGVSSDCADLVNAWQSISASHRNYRLLVIGATGNPQGAAIAMVPDPMQADPSLRVDLRTHEERVRAAKSAWAAWEAKINALPVPNLKWALRGALDGFMGEGALWRDAAPTITGRVAVQALREVAK